MGVSSHPMPSLLKVKTVMECSPSPKISLWCETRTPLKTKRSLPASLDYAEIRINTAAKLFGSNEDDPGLARICGTVSIPDLHDEDEEPITSIDGGLFRPSGRSAGRLLLRWSS